MYFFINRKRNRGKGHLLGKIIHHYPLFTLCVRAFPVCNLWECKLFPGLPTFFHRVNHKFVDCEIFFFFSFLRFNPPLLPSCLSPATFYVSRVLFYESVNDFGFSLARVLYREQKDGGKF